MKHINYKITLTHVIDRNSQDILGTFYHKKEDVLEAFDNYKLDDEDKGKFIITLSEVFEDENGKETINTLKVKELKKELKYGYQAVHDNCEPYEDNYTIHESTIYMNKENLIKRIKAEGYEEKRSGYLQDGEPYYYKDNIEDVPLFREDMITIHELEVINNTLEEE